MQSPSKKPSKDLIQELIEDCLMAFPVSSLLIGLYKQYGQRGFLTKKQLQGLYHKASEVKDISPGRLATLEALIKKMPNRYKSALPEHTPLYEKNEEAAALIDAILQKYPQHKRVLFLKTKFDSNELGQNDMEELKRFAKLLKV